MGEPDVRERELFDERGENMDGRREPGGRDGAGPLYIRMQGNLRGEEEHSNSSLKDNA